MTPLSNTSPIIVLGSGSWGTALALTLARNGNQVRLWGHLVDQMETMQKTRENTYFLPGFPFPDSIEASADLKQVFSDIQEQPGVFQDIVLVVPTEVFTIVVLAMKPFLQKNSRVLCASKGLSENGALLKEAFIDLMDDDFKTIPFGILAGPSFAQEVAAQLPTAVSCATSDPDFTRAMQQRFHSQYFNVYRSDDVVGLELGGAVKNVLAIMTGISDGLGWGSNTKCALITRGLAELKALYKALGAKPESLLALSGVGDLILTCTDNQSRNRRFGLALAHDLDPQAAEKSVGQVVEGKRNIPMVLALFKKYHIACPVCEQVAAIIDQKLKPREALLQLFSGPPSEEF